MGLNLTYHPTDEEARVIARLRPLVDRAAVERGYLVVSRADLDVLEQYYKHLEADERRQAAADPDRVPRWYTYQGRRFGGVMFKGVELLLEHPAEAADRA